MNERITVSLATVVLMSFCRLNIATAQITETKLIPDDEWNPRSFSLFGENVLVGSQWSGEIGSAYIFHFDGSNWVQQTKLTANDGRSGD